MLMRANFAGPKCGSQGRPSFLTYLASNMWPSLPRPHFRLFKQVYKSILRYSVSANSTRLWPYCMLVKGTVLHPSMLSKAGEPKDTSFTSPSSEMLFMVPWTRLLGSHHTFSLGIANATCRRTLRYRMLPSKMLNRRWWCAMPLSLHLDIWPGHQFGQSRIK